MDREKLKALAAELAKDDKTEAQPEVIQVLLDKMIEEDIAPTLLKIREDKVKARSMVKNNVLLGKFRKLTPEQLTKLGEI